MKKYRNFLLCVGLLLASLFASAGNSDRAVTISLKDFNGSDVNAIKQIVGQAVNDGVVDTFLIYNPSNMAKNKFFACVESTANAEQWQFNNFVNTLHHIALTDGRYQLKTTAKCGSNDALMCISSPLSCFTNAFLYAKGAYQDYVAKAQFQASLAEITVGKLQMEMKLNQWWDIATPTDIGIESSTKNCSMIWATGTAADGNADIGCTVLGNSKINGATITWHRTGSTGKWLCSATNATSGADITKYQGNCKGY